MMLLEQTNQALGASLVRALAFCLLLPLIGTAEEESPKKPLTSGLMAHSLKDFGPVGHRGEVQATFIKAMEALAAKGGGILVVPEDVAACDLENTFRRSYCAKPEDDDILHYWKNSPAVLVIDYRGGDPVLRLPQIASGESGVGAGIVLERIMRLRHGDSVPHASKDSVLEIKNRIIHGTCSYRDVTALPVEASEDARFYVHNVRGLFEGMYLNVAAKVPKEGSKYLHRIGDAIIIKKIAYDKERKLSYFTAETKIDWPIGTDLQNKTHNPAIRIVNNYHSPNQTFDFYMHRNQYGHGDSYMYHARFGYMGNVNSGGGDENGACYTAYIYSLYNSFRGVVESVDWERNRLIYAQGENAQTLSSTRPLINLNQEKWITQGKIVVVPAESYWDTVDTGKYPYKGKTYPSTVSTEQGVMGLRGGLRMGGLIRGDADCPWDESIVGRFFAVDEKTEYVPRTAFGGTVQGIVRRWYEITNVKRNVDGTKDLFIKRYWWGVKEACSPTLYSPENFTYDGHERPLSYVIAPGTYVFDVSEAVDGKPRGKPPYALYIAPFTDTGTRFDFQPGDPIKQAIGPDPFKPQAMRFIVGDAVPGAWPAGLIDLHNVGSVARDYGFKIRGHVRTLEACAKRPDGRPPYGSVLNIDCASEVGIDCRADFADAAILFRQRYEEQPIKWEYGERETGKPVKRASLKVTKDSGDLVFQGGDARFSGSVVAKGLSGDETPARNLRGKKVPVKAGTKVAEIKFTEPEPDANYAVFIEQTWLTNRAVTERTAEGFRVAFDQPAPEGATLDWLLVR